MLSDDKLKELSEKLKSEQSETPVKIEKVMEVLGYRSKSAARHALMRMAEIGLVKWKRTGVVKGEWFLL